MQTVLIVEPASSGLGLLRAAKERGLRVLVISANKEDRIIPNEYRPYIDRLIIAETNDPNLMKAELEKVEETVSAVIPGFEHFVETAAQLAHLLQVPAVPLETAHALRNKSAQREKLFEAGVRVPKFTVVKQLEDLRAEPVQSIGFPCIIKPLEQSGSVGVALVKNQQELEAAYKEMSHDQRIELGKGIGSTVLVEEYADGREVAAEGFVQDGVVNIVSVTEKKTTRPPHFIELRHIVETDIDTQTRQAIQAYMEAIAKALNITMGAFQAEINIDEKGPVLIEIAGRIAGDRVCDLILLARGINMWNIVLQAYLQEKIILPTDFKERCAGMDYYLLEPDKRSFATVEGLDAVKQLPGFKEFRLLYQPGQRVPPHKDFSARMAYCIFDAPDYPALVATLEEAKRLLRFPAEKRAELSVGVFIQRQEFPQEAANALPASSLPEIPRGTL